MMGGCSAGVIARFCATFEFISVPTSGDDLATFVEQDSIF